ncbi:hypothetical protein T11_7169 [Trichinella zimbabwensis]|uniref:Uncharacterized protein n=1 Tax=Trichinella zimbabwensis TaxID=268475 RepID=A0A0V1HEU7_9BILA|nr:hypothetical protein T11_7169 [Trichinella zimbabwensis]
MTKNSQNMHYLRQRVLAAVEIEDEVENSKKQKWDKGAPASIAPEGTQNGFVVCKYGGKSMQNVEEAGHGWYGIAERGQA